MKELQNVVSDVRIIKFKWQEPGLIDLTRARQLAQGSPCTNTGSGAGDGCFGNGSSAIGTCSLTGSGV